MTAEPPLPEIRGDPRADGRSRWWPADPAGWRGLAVSFAVFVAVAAMFVMGAQLLDADGSERVRRWLTLARGPWALPGSVAVFTVLAFVGAPQLLLIAAAVVVFGPTWGAVYSWVGTLVSSAIGFMVGRMMKPRLIDRSSGGGVGRYAALIARNGFWATIVVRLTPVAPFFLVNLAGGASGMALADYLAGTALGIIPKIALTAFAGRSTLRLMRQAGVLPLLFLAAALILWLCSGLLARRLAPRQPP